MITTQQRLEAVSDMLVAAQTELAALRVTVAELRRALAPFAEMSTHPYWWEAGLLPTDCHGTPLVSVPLKLGDCLRARELLARTGDAQ